MSERRNSRRGSIATRADHHPLDDAFSNKNRFKIRLAGCKRIMPSGSLKYVFNVTSSSPISATTRSPFLAIVAFHQNEPSRMPSSAVRLELPRKCHVVPRPRPKQILEIQLFGLSARFNGESAPTHQGKGQRSFFVGGNVLTRAKERVRFGSCVRTPFATSNFTCSCTVTVDAQDVRHLHGR